MIFRKCRSPVIPDHAWFARPRRQPRLVYLFRGRRRHRQTAARHQYINSVNSALGCCRFVTDEVRRQIRYRLRWLASDSGRLALQSCPGPQLMPKLFSDPEAIAEDIIRDVGTNLVVGLPLGLGKANHVVNALYARAAADRSINLTLFSALTLEKPRPSQPARTALHRPGDRPPVRRLSRPRLCRRAACR